MRRYLPDRHPIFWHELRRRIFGRRWYVLPLVTLGIAGLLVGGYVLYAGMNGSWLFANDWESLLWLAIPLIWLIVYVFAPSLSAGLIAGERDSGALEFLFLSPLTSREVVLQKYAATLLPFGALLLATSPVSLYLMWSREGIDGRGYFYVMLLFPALAAACFCAIGIFISSLLRNTRSAMVVTYVVVVIGSFLTPIPLGFVFEIARELFGSSDMEGGVVFSTILIILFITILCLRAAIGAVERLRGAPTFWHYTGMGVKKPQEG